MEDLQKVHYVYHECPKDVHHFLHSLFASSVVFNFLIEPRFERLLNGLQLECHEVITGNELIKFHEIFGQIFFFLTFVDELIISEFIKIQLVI